MLSKEMLAIYRPIWAELTGEFVEFAEMHAEADGFDAEFSEDYFMHGDPEERLTLLDIM